MTFWKAPKDAGCLLPREPVLWLGFGTFSPTPDLKEGEIEFLSPEVIDLIDCTCNKASRKPTGDGKLLPSIKIPFYFLEGGGSENTEVLHLSKHGGKERILYYHTIWLCVVYILLQ